MVRRMDGKDSPLVSKLMEEAVDEFEKEAVDKQKHSMLAARIECFQHDHWEGASKLWEEEPYLLACEAESNKQIF